MPSEGYYMDARSDSPQTGLVAKMLTVFEAAGLERLNTGALYGLGSRDYTLIEVEQQPMTRHIFALDRRPSRQRLKAKFKKFTPFPYDRYGGQGFRREMEVDIEYVKEWQDTGGNGEVTDAPGTVGEATVGD